MVGLELVGFGAFTPGGAVLLDGSESDGANLLLSGPAALTSGWNTLDATLTSNNAVAPNGATEAARILEQATTNRHGIYHQPSISAGDTRTYSAYAKSITRRYVQLLVAANSGTGTIYAYFDLLTGAVTASGIGVNSGTTTIGTPTIEAAVNGFWKCTVPGVRLNGTAALPFFQLMASDVGIHGAPLVSDSPSYAGNTSNGLHVWRPKVA